MKENSPKTALITGGSSGIGFELAKKFGKNGYDLVLVANNPEKLEASSDSLRAEFPERNIQTFRQDLSLVDAAKSVHSYVKGRNIEINALVNNAGYGEYGEFSERSYDDHMAIINTNYVTPVGLTSLFLPDMIARESGYILNIASSAAFQPGPFMSMYHSTKAGIVPWSIALAEENRSKGIAVSVSCPGLTKTEFFERPNMGQPLSSPKLAMTAERVAKESFNGLMNGEILIIPGKKNQLIFSTLRLIPPTLFARLVYWRRKR